jgi:hypothetical protein
MPLITAHFTQYVVYYVAGASAAAGMPQDAEIDCFDGAGNRAGAIYFYPASGRLPKNQSTANGIYLYFRIARFSDVMTMLKYEKPLGRSEQVALIVVRYCDTDKRGTR